MIAYPTSPSSINQDSDQHQMLTKMALQHLWMGDKERAFSILSHIKPVKYDRIMVELVRLSKRLQLSQSDTLPIINKIKIPTLKALAVVHSLNIWSELDNSRESELLNLAEQLLHDFCGDMSDLIEQARAAINNEEFAFAYELLWDVAHHDIYNDEAWYLLSTVTDNHDVRKTCLENVLAINSYNEQAKKQRETVTKDIDDDIPLNTTISTNPVSTDNDPFNMDYSFDFEDDNYLYYAVFDSPVNDKPKIKALSLDSSLFDYVIAELTRHLLISRRIESAKPFATSDNDHLRKYLTLSTLKVAEQYLAEITYDEAMIRRLLEDAISIAESVRTTRKAPLIVLCCQFLNYINPIQAETLFLTVYDEWKTVESTQIGLECGFTSVLPELKNWWNQAREKAQVSRRPTRFSSNTPSPTLDVSSFVSPDKIGQTLKFVGQLDNAELQRFMFESLDNAIKDDIGKSHPIVPNKNDEALDTSAIDLLGKAGIVIDKEMLAILNDTDGLLTLLDRKIVSALEEIAVDDDFDDDFG